MNVNLCKKSKCFVAFTLTFAISLFSLVFSTENKYPLNLSFCGDIMGHKNNWIVSDYSKAYEDVLPFLLHDDLTFANFEIPVCNSLPYSNYPRFNVHSEYADEAIKAGFNVFSLINNHTNDQYLTGILSTYKYFTSKRSHDIYSAGIKMKDSEEISYDIIECNGWRILFCAVTEILNDYRVLTRLDYFAPTEKGHEKLKTALKNVTQKHQHDLFILSLHCNEPEYVLKVKESRKQYYRELLDCGVDIISANHQHVMQEWEILKNKQTGKNDKLIIYGLGNFLSGQRRVINYEKPQDVMEYIGDSIILQTHITWPVDIINVRPVYITNYIDEDIVPGERYFLVKHFSQSFIENVMKKDKRLGQYYKKRYDACRAVQGKHKWH